MGCPCECFSFLILNLLVFDTSLADMMILAPFVIMLVTALAEQNILRIFVENR